MVVIGASELPLIREELTESVSLAKHLALLGAGHRLIAEDDSCVPPGGSPIGVISDDGDDGSEAARAAASVVHAIHDAVARGACGDDRDQCRDHEVGRYVSLDLDHVNPCLLGRGVAVEGNRQRAGVEVTGEDVLVQLPLVLDVTVHVEVTEQVGAAAVDVLTPHLEHISALPARALDVDHDRGRGRDHTGEEDSIKGEGDLAISVLHHQVLYAVRSIAAAGVAEVGRVITHNTEIITIRKTNYVVEKSARRLEVRVESHLSPNTCVGDRVLALVVDHVMRNVADRVLPVDH